MYFDGIFIKSHDIASKVEATLKLKFVEDLFFLLLKKTATTTTKIVGIRKKESKASEQKMKKVMFRILILI